MSGPGVFPTGWENGQIIFVNQKPKKGAPPLKHATGKRQGIWKESFSSVPNLSEVWVYEEKHVPKALLNSGHPYGAWGYKPGADPARCPPEDIWFFPPNVTPHRLFTVLGKWSFPLRKRDISSIEPEQAGFLKVGSAVSKNEKLDVGGTWKLLYQRDGEPKGPGVLPPMNVHVQKPDGSRVTIQVRPTDTIDDVKSKIKEKTGIPEIEQRLFFNAQPLRDGSKTLDNLGIENNDTLVLEPMIVFIEDTKGRQYSLAVEPNDQISNVKSKLEAQEGIPKAQQRLHYKGKMLDDKPTLKDYGVRHKNVLYLEPMQIYVETPEGKKVQLDVDPSDTIEDVKKLVEDKENIPANEQKLTFHGKELEDYPTLADSNINHGDTLKLDSMKIHVRTPQGKKMTFAVKPENTIGDIKQMVENEEGIPKANQRLLQDGDKPLKYDSQTLSECNIGNGDILDLEGMQIIIKDWTGKKFPLNVEPNETIDSIKEMIEDHEHIPKDQQYLLYGGNLLDDPEKTLADHGIKHKDVVDLDRMKIYIKDWKGKTFTLDVDPTDTTEDVKKKIQDRENIPVKDQLLKFEAKPLEDPKTLDESGIKYKDTLDLDKNMISPKRSPKKKVAAPTTPTEQDKSYVVQLSPWKGLEGGYTKKEKIKREGKKAGSKDLLKARYHTDLATEVAELGVKAMEKHSKEHKK